MRILNLTLPFLLLGLFQTAQAGSLSLILRADSDTTTYNDAAERASATNLDSTRYLAHTARLEYKGQLNESLSFLTRVRFEGVTNTTPNKTDNLTDGLDLLQITHRLVDDLSLTVGKLALEILADDGIPASDIYLASRARADVAPIYLYGTGIKLAKTFGTNEIKLMSFNQSEGTSTEQTKTGYGVVYKGKFLDKTLLPILSYHRDNRQSAVSAQDPTVEMWAAGLRFDPKPYYISYDYLQNNRDNMTGTGTSSVASAFKSNTIVSHLIDAGYQLDPQWIVRLRWDLSRKTAQDKALRTESISDYEGVGLATEFKPFKDEMFRYHLAWTQLTEKPQSGPDQITQHIILGAMIYADFLK